MADNGVPFPNEAQHRVELRPVRVFARSLVREQLVRLQAIELAEIGLIEGAHALVPNDQTLAGAPSTSLCSDRLSSLHHQVLDKPEPTLTARESVRTAHVRLGYTLRNAKSIDHEDEVVPPHPVISFFRTP